MTCDFRTEQAKKHTRPSKWGSDVRFGDQWSFAAIRAFAIALVLALALEPAHAASAASQPAPKSPALPETLTQESARDLVSRLTDEQVLSLLLQQLGRVAEADATSSATRGKHGMMGMAGVVDQHAQSMRDVYTELTVAFYALPTTLSQVWARISGVDNEALTPLARLLALMLGAAVL